MLTAAHIINRLPTPILENKTPYEILYNEPTPYVHLRVFGCLAFASNPLYTTDKLAPRSVPSVFIGYTPTNKVYRLLNLTTMQTFISRDVMFHEDIFPFNLNTDKSYISPLPTELPQPN